MEREYYEVKTWMKFEKTVLVPKDEVESAYEAKELVRDAVSSCEIELLTDDRCYEDGESIGEIIAIDDSDLDTYCSHFEVNIIHKDDYEDEDEED